MFFIGHFPFDAVIFYRQDMIPVVGYKFYLVPVEMDEIYITMVVSSVYVKNFVLSVWGIDRSTVNIFLPEELCFEV